MKGKQFTRTKSNKLKIYTNNINLNYKIDI